MCALFMMFTLNRFPSLFLTHTDTRRIERRSRSREPRVFVRIHDASRAQLLTRRVRSTQTRRLEKDEANARRDFTLENRLESRDERREDDDDNDGKRRKGCSGTTLVSAGWSIDLVVVAAAEFVRAIKSR